MGQGKRKVPADDGSGAEEPTHDHGPSSSKKVLKNDGIDLTPINDDESPAEARLEVNEPNPFLLNPVLKVIMSQMTIEDLKRSRGVCTLWDHQSTLELQKLSSQIKGQIFGEVDEIQGFANSLEESSNKIFISHKINTTLQALSAQRRRFFQEFQPKTLIIWIEDEDSKVTLQLIKILINSSKYINKLSIKGLLKLKHRQFGGKIKWPEKLQFPQLEILNVDLTSGDTRSEIEDVQFIIKNILKNAPKFKSLSLVDQPIGPLCDLMTCYDLIGKLQDFYGCSHGNLVYADDLLQMAKAGLKLSKFVIFDIFENLSRDVILEHLEKFKEFLTTQSDTLMDLRIKFKWRHFDDGDDICKFNMPPLPKLKVLLVMGNDDKKTCCISYTPMDLPYIFPNLSKIVIILKSDLCDLSEMFKGSLDCVKKVTIRVRHSYLNKIENYTKRCHQLETYFPHVIEFDMDHIKGLDWDKMYEYMPWKNTLKKLTLHPPKLENLKFESLKHWKELFRLELLLINYSPNSLMEEHADFEFESLSKTSVKSLKIQNYLIHEKVVEEIRSRFILDYNYIPPKSD